MQFCQPNNCGSQEPLFLFSCELLFFPLCAFFSSFLSWPYDSSSSSILLLFPCVPITTINFCVPITTINFCSSSSRHSRLLLLHFLPVVAAAASLDSCSDRGRRKELIGDSIFGELLSVRWLSSLARSFNLLVNASNSLIFSLILEIFH